MRNLLLFFILIAHGQIFYAQTSLFIEDSLLPISLRGDIKSLLKNRTGEAINFPFTLSYKNQNATIDLPVAIRTRGHFRRELGPCIYPPLLIQFEQEVDPTLLFYKQKKLKLVVPCQSDQLILSEYLAYKSYEVVSTFHFKTRLVSIQFIDTKNDKSNKPFYAFLIEDEDQMAARYDMKIIEKAMLPQQTRQHDFLTMAVFEYYIGNTDWSVQYLQNIKLMAKNEKELPIPVPYDFDHAGIVNAPYARPAMELQLSSTRERRYRGYCVAGLDQYNEILNKYHQLKPNLYAIFDNVYLQDNTKKQATKFIDDFYKVINNPKKWQHDFLYPCDPGGTGNVVIKGLKK